MLNPEISLHCKIISRFAKKYDYILTTLTSFLEAFADIPNRRAASDLLINLIRFRFRTPHCLSILKYWKELISLCDSHRYFLIFLLILQMIPKAENEDSRSKEESLVF